MPVSDVYEILGQPDRIRKASDVLEASGREVVLSADYFSGQSYSTWDRSEGKYQLVLYDGKLSDIHSLPTRTLRSAVRELEAKETEVEKSLAALRATRSPQTADAEKTTECEP